MALTTAAQDPRDALRAADQRALERTLEEQGGASHASGQRPELGATHAARVVAADAASIRVGLTPTAFQADGSLRLEYDTAAAHNHDRVEITADAAFTLVDLASGATIATLGANDAASLVRRGEPIAVSGPLGSLGTWSGPVRVRTDGLLTVASMRRIDRLAPLVGGSFQMAPPAYRGELEVRRSEADAARLRLVNVVSLEPYVAGVVVNESLSTFHVEALRSQAVAARGYALANFGRFASRGFDIDDSTLSQVYRGRSSETETARSAQEGTEGLVALRDGRILQALYSSSMGGHTESNEYVFPAGGYPGDNPDPALRGIHDSADPLREDLSTDAGALAFYSSVAPAAYEVGANGTPLTSLHRWTRTRTAAELLARLEDPSRAWGVPASATTIRDLRTTLRGASGRSMQVVITGDWGETILSGWSDLRALATLASVTPGGTAANSAPNSPSTFSVTRGAAGAVASVTFVGGGFGHNVGMSQYGAHGRALRGQDFSQILAGYYSGAQLGTAPLSLAAAPRAWRFRSLEAATLEIENDGLDDVALEINGRRLVIPLRRFERREVDLAPYLTTGGNEVRLVGRGSGNAIVSIQLDAGSPPGRSR